MVTKEDVNSRFLEAVRRLKAKGYTQKDIVEAAGLSQNAISKIKTGQNNAGDDTINKICAAFELNPDFFYSGSQQFTIDEKGTSIPCEPALDQSSLINATIAAQMKTIEILEAQAVEKDIRIAELKDTIAAKEEIIKARDARIIELERQLAAAATSDLSRYPFSIGAADGHNLPDVSPNP